MARRKKTAQRADEIRSATPSDPAAEYEGGAIEYYLTEALSFVKRNLKEVVIVVVAVMLIIVGSAVYWNFREKQKQAALIEFEKMLKTPVMDLERGVPKKAEEKLAEYAKTYSYEEARRRAQVQRLDYLAQAGELTAAAELATKLASQLDYPEQRAYFNLRAGIYYENAGKYSLALEGYSQASQLMREENLPRATAVFGEARCLLRIGRTGDGKAKIGELLRMNKVDKIDQLRAQAAAFLATLPPTAAPK